MDQQFDKALSLLKYNKLKLTKQRKDMIRLLMKYQHQYIEVTTIDAHMRSIYPGMSYNTTYRNVKDFEKIGILEQRQQGDQICVKFQCDFGLVHHHHFICRNCGKVIELKMCPLDIFAEQIPNCTIESHEFEMYGLCDECTQKTAIKNI